MNAATFARHGVDWCHLCGRRRQTCDVFYATNAENDRPDSERPRYVRICDDCAWQILSFATAGRRRAPEPEEPHPR
jgi:hypothetical protein